MADEARHTLDRQLRDMLDAVRTSVNDLADPDFARLAQRVRQDPDVRQMLGRSQRLDLAIGEALDDLPIPAGSVDRLLAALRSASQPAKMPTAAVAETASSSEPHESLAQPEPSATPSPLVERAPLWQSWLAPAALVCVAGVALVAYAVLRPADVALTPDEILASGWLAAADEAAFEQTPLEKQAPPRRFPASPSLAVKPVAWRTIKGLLDRPRGVAYQLRSAAARATLYVIDEDAGHDAPQFGALPASPAAGPMVTTGGRAMSVWRSGGLVYILVVQGGEAEYKSFQSAAGQLARNDVMPRAGNYRLAQCDFAAPPARSAFPLNPHAANRRT